MPTSGDDEWSAEAYAFRIQVGTFIGEEDKRLRARYDEVARPWLLDLRLQKGEREGVGLAFGLFVEEVLAIAD